MKNQVGVDVGSYVFAPGAAGAGTITFTGMPAGFGLAQILLIVDTVSGAYIYNPLDPTTNGTFAAGVLTLEANTSSLSASDPLQIFVNLVSDNAVLDNLTDNTTGPGNVYSTTGFSRIAFQLGGQWAGSVVIEGSNDNATWYRLLPHNVSDGSVADVILTSGVYAVPCATAYMRYNILEMAAGSIAAVVVGRITPLAETPLLSQSFDHDSGVQMQVSLAGGVAKDPQNALILSDAPGPIQINGAVNSNIIIDTQGYQTLHVTTQAMVANVTSSNDKNNWSSLSLMGTTYSGLSTSVTASANFIIPCAGRYIKFAVTTAGTATLYLRNQYSGVGSQDINLIQISGTGPVTAGVAGMLAVGGNIATGSAPTANPVYVAGKDTAGSTRPLLTDPTGAIEVIGNTAPGAAPSSNPVSVSGVDQANLTRRLGVVAAAGVIQNIPALAVQEQSTFESQSVAELFGQILIELRLANYYLFRLPEMLNAGSVYSMSEEPSNMRNDPTSFV